MYAGVGNLITADAAKLLKFVKEHNWHSPKMSYNQSNVLEYCETRTNTWLAVSQYSKNAKLTYNVQVYLNNN